MRVAPASGAVGLLSYSEVEAPLNNSVRACTAQQAQKHLINFSWVPGGAAGSGARQPLSAAHRRRSFPSLPLGGLWGGGSATARSAASSGADLRQALRDPAGPLPPGYSPGAHLISHNPITPALLSLHKWHVGAHAQGFCTVRRDAIVSNNAPFNTHIYGMQVKRENPVCAVDAQRCGLICLLALCAVPEPRRRQERAASSPLPDIGALILDDGEKVLRYSLLWRLQFAACAQAVLVCLVAA